jgi:hypothetical protein
MARHSLSSAAFVFTLAVATGLSAQAPAPAPDTATSETTSPATAALVTKPAAPASTQPAPKRNRAISGDVAAMLSATMPKFTPPAAPAPAPTAAEIAQKKADAEAAAKAEAEADLRDADKPKNGIVRLPKYVVQEQRPVILKEKDINKAEGLRALAMRRYTTDAGRALNRFSVPLFAAWSPGSDKGSTTEQRAMFMYYEDERLKNMSDLADNANMIMRSDAKAGTAAKDEVQKTYMRASEFGYNGMAPK